MRYDLGLFVLQGQLILFLKEYGIDYDERYLWSD
jgi:hypothetical protein